MNKDNDLFLFSKACIFLTWVVLFYAFFSTCLASTEGVYLPYNSSCATDWNDYPDTPSAINHACLKKRYCSDIEYPIIKATGFDRCRGECESLNDFDDTVVSITSSSDLKGIDDSDYYVTSVVSGDNSDVKYKVIVSTINMSDSDSCSAESSNTINSGITSEGSLSEIVTAKSINSGSKCLKIKLTPLIFSGTTVYLADGTTVKNADEPAAFYFTTGHNGKTGSNQNCFLKSCLDLTTEEFEAIDYSTNFSTDSDGNLAYDAETTDYDGILLYKFCEPHKYTGTITMNTGTKVKYYDPSSDGYDDEYVYCHEFEDEDALEFLWKYGKALGSSDDEEGNYECVLHQCPISSGQSLSCDTNYYLFYDRSSSYLKNYEQYVLENTSSDPLSNPLKDTSCSALSCTTARFITNLECTNASTLNSSCDKYTGFDVNFTSITDPTDYGLSEQTSCYLSNSKYYCYKTYDCGADSSYEVCIDTDEDTEDTTDGDETLSYFYKPVPPNPATEICPSDNQDSDGNDTCETDRVIIRRTLRGINDYPNERPKSVEDYFKDDLSSTDRDNMCTDSSGFKKFESYTKKILLITYTYGRYYNGFWRVTKSGVLPHILPLCDKSSLGVKGKGREYLCGNNGYICNAPYWDSYYIRGEPTYEWKDDEANISTVSVRACLRQKNTGELGVCGNRECRVDCAFGTCKYQWCGIDRCVSLKLEEGESCSLEDVREGKSGENCYKVFSKSSLSDSALRFRLTMIDRRVYVFLDVQDAGCSSGGSYIGNMSSIRRGDTQDSYNTAGDNESTIGGTFRGRLDEYSLFDDNSLTDYNCDGEITDEDIFGEYLFNIWNCQKLVDYAKDSENVEEPTIASADTWCYKDDNEQTAEERGEVHPYCSSYKINNGENPTISDTSSNWITWDIVQYQGNNQQISSTFCTIGALDNCRGYYDKNDSFVREMQAFKVDIPIHPQYFYKYATSENTPDLFLPLLTLYSFRQYEDVSYTIYANADADNIELDFFRPSIVAKYDEETSTATIPFAATEITGSMTTEFNGEDITANYVFRKTSKYYPAPSARVCLYQVLTSGTEQQIKCLNRVNPEISNFVIKPYNVNITSPLVNAYFHEEDLTDVTTALDLDDDSKFITFYDEINDTKNLLSSIYVYAQGFRIFLEDSYCSKINYSCIFYQKEYNEKKDLSTTTDEELSDLEGNIELCENTIETYCNTQNGGEKFVQNKNDSTFIKVKANNTANGAYNQMCVSEGFEDYQTYVEALPSVDGVAGKCILDNDSKKNSDCRKTGYYEFCSTAGSDGCECLDGSSSCTCGSYGCIKEVDCSCSGDSCLTLPEACFLPGFNANLSVLDSEGIPMYSCNCTTVSSSASSTSGTVIRKSTAREMGLCVDLMHVDFCDPIKYYNENKVYYDGGDGELLSTIKTDYKSNIWRTNQIVFGKYYIDNYGHAEFDKTTDCKKNDSDSSDDLPDDFCLLSKRCYSTNSTTKGQTCLSTDEDCECDKYLQYGTCNGFWKTKYNTTPLASCETETDKFGQVYSKFELVEGTGCERYSCAAITDSESPTDEEVEESANATEESDDSVNTEGKSNGFATWKKYKKGTYGMSDTDLANDLENDYGDELEQRSALYCLQGYAPAGSNFAIKNYIPVVSITSNSETTKTIQTISDRLAKTLIGYGVENVTYDTSGNESSAATTTDISNYKEFVSKTGYTAREHLPVRYCSQLGNWMSMNDIYTEFGVNPYYTSDEVFHSPGTESDGFLSDDIKTTYSIPTARENTYGDTIDYSERFCERLYCQTITEDDVGLLSIEDSEPDANSGLTYTLSETDTSDFGLDTIDTSNNVAYPNNETSWSKNSSCVSQTPSGNYNNYPEDTTNCSDTRGYSMVNNKYTIWRHAGGATWSETPSPRSDDVSDDVEGTCLETKNFYPSGVVFLSSFDNQYNTIDFSDATYFDIKNISFKNGSDNEVNPTRTCSKWGQWSEINNRCEVACEAVDVFRTNFVDTNSDEKLQNHEITKFYKIPHYRGDYYITNSTTGITYGDEYTGGAKWPRAVVSDDGEYVVGECDATVGEGYTSVGFPTSGVQFMRNGTDTTYSGAPYRKCLADGTWGPVINPCINFKTCPDINISNSDIFSSTNIDSEKNVVLLSGGSITYQETSSSVEVSSDCSDNPNYESGTVIESCNVSTGKWMNDLSGSCVLKTCDHAIYGFMNTSSSLYVVNYLKSTNQITNLYYPTDSGLTGSLSLSYDGNTYGYIDNSFEVSCPTGYYYNDALSANITNINDTTSKIKYTCSLNSSNNTVWNRTGECVPAVCKFSSLNMSNLGLTGRSSITKPTIANYSSGGNYYAKAGQSSYTPLKYAAGITGTSYTYIGNITVDGTYVPTAYGDADYATSGTILKVDLPCATGYTFNSTNGTDTTPTVEIKCTSDSITGSTGVWSATTNGTCDIIQCSTFDHSQYNGSFTLSQNGTCGDGTSSILCPGATYTLAYCDSGYTKDTTSGSTLTVTCNDEGEWEESGDAWCGADCAIQSVTRYVVDTAWLGSCSSSYMAIKDNDGDEITDKDASDIVTSCNTIASIANDDNEIRVTTRYCADDDKTEVKSSSFSITRKFLSANHGSYSNFTFFYHPDVEKYKDRRYGTKFFYKCEDGSFVFKYAITSRGVNNEDICPNPSTLWGD
ncbi:MAG TPA: hypothetical protein VLL98_01755 [Rickettsiales bacterium]|nr:hypothetical protein [Rickettsiales bacterium]